MPKRPLWCKCYSFTWSQIMVAKCHCLHVYACSARVLWNVGLGFCARWDFVNIRLWFTVTCMHGVESTGSYLAKWLLVIIFDFESLGAIVLRQNLDNLSFAGSYEKSTIFVVLRVWIHQCRWLNEAWICVSVCPSTACADVRTLQLRVGNGTCMDLVCSMQKEKKKPVRKVPTWNNQGHKKAKFPANCDNFGCKTIKCARNLDCFLSGKAVWATHRKGCNFARATVHISAGNIAIRQEFFARTQTLHSILEFVRRCLHIEVVVRSHLWEQSNISFTPNGKVPNLKV